VVWKIIFTIYIEKQNNRIILAKYKVNNSTELNKILTEFFIAKKEMEETYSVLNTWDYEISLVDELNCSIKLNKLYEIAYNKEGIISFFNFSKENTGGILLT